MLNSVIWSFVIWAVMILGTPLLEVFAKETYLGTYYAMALEMVLVRSVLRTPNRYVKHFR